MLTISRSAVLGLFAANYLSKRPGRMVCAQEIADAGGISRNAIIGVLQTLRREGILRATRGDGFTLARGGDEISLFDILAAVDGPMILRDACLMGRGSCEFGATCPVSTLCRKTRDVLGRGLTETTVDRMPADAEGIPVCLKGR
jgi:Rrf2 family protein